MEKENGITKTLCCGTGFYFNSSSIFAITVLIFTSRAEHMR